MPKSNLQLLRKGYEVSAFGKSATITLYGQIVESRPWWAEESDLFIVLKEFIDDLESLNDVTDLTIRLNSVGGDAYSSFTIHNRLRELSRNGTKVTGIVDGVAMSGGSLILCGCDTVQVNPSSIVMVHDCWRYVWDMANSTDLRKMADEMDVINNSQAEIYVRKTGKQMEEIRNMMQETTYMSGREAVEKGFADELIEDAEDPDIEVSEDRRTLYACGRKMRVAAMGQLPEGIKTHVEKVETEPKASGNPVDGQAGMPEARDGGDNNPPVASGENEGGHSNMTWEEFLAQNPEAANQALANARAEAVTAERRRMAEIDEVATLFDSETVNAAKYGENACTAEQLAYRVAQANVKQGKAFMQNLQSDTTESNVNKVPAASAPTDEQPKAMSNEEKVAAGRELARSLKGEKKEEV